MLYVFTKAAAVTTDVDYEALLSSHRMDAYRFACETIHSRGELLWGASIEPNFLAHHLHAAHRISRSLQASTDDDDDDESRARVMNVYGEAAPRESQRCVGALVRVRARVSELLEQFEENPVLLNVVEVVDRVERFSIQSPLMRFVVGLETLKTKMQVSFRCVFLRDFCFL